LFAFLTCAWSSSCSSLCDISSHSAACASFVSSFAAVLLCLASFSHVHPSLRLAFSFQLRAPWLGPLASPPPSPLRRPFVGLAPRRFPQTCCPAPSAPSLFAILSRCWCRGSAVVYRVGCFASLSTPVGWAPSPFWSSVPCPPCPLGAPSTAYRVHFLRVFVTPLPSSHSRPFIRAPASLTSRCRCCARTVQSVRLTRLALPLCW